MQCHQANGQGIKEVFPPLDGSPYLSGEPKLLANILQEKSFTEKELKKVAVILPNEDLLLSVLESIPTKINSINVTMGYKLTHHPVISLFQDVLNVFINTRNIKVGLKSQTRHFAKKDIIKLLNDISV